MKIKTTQTREQILQFITETAMADSEGAVIKGLTALMNPLDSRSEMGEVFEENLGYNPITCYDVADVENLIAELVQDSTNPTIAKLVSAKRRELVQRSMELYEAGREEQMQLCIVKAASEMFGANDAEQIAGAMGIDIADILDIGSGTDDDTESFEDPDVMGYRSSPDDDDDLIFGDDDDDDDD